jgi:Asp-tRNA(Asn)/Glu-tRNA(Gln) amidotransferase A subunit family amidase
MQVGKAEDANESEEKTFNTADVYARTRSKGFGREAKKRILLGSYALSAEFVLLISFLCRN